MPRDPFAALVQLLVGALLGAAGFLMIGWAVMTHFRIEWGFDAVLWALEHSPIPLSAPPLELANSAIQQGSLIAIGVAGFFAWIIGSALRRAGAKNMRPASAEEPSILYAPPTPPTPPATTKHAGSTVFAHKMLSDLPSHAPSHASSHAPSHAPRTARPSPVAPGTHAEPPLSPPSRLEAEFEGLARLIGTDGKFTPQQREALAKLTPEQHAALAKFSKWAPSRKNAIIALIAIFFAFQLLPAIFSFLLNL